jgi:multiple sugar transport system substrate-binding protein
MIHSRANRGVYLLVLALSLGCSGQQEERTVITFPISAVGKEAEVLQRQLARFQEQHPHIRVAMRKTPDAADQKHQLYVQWLNARASVPDILQLDVIWAPEFAAAGWVLPLDRFRPDLDDFFPATVRANRWQGELFALPWFVDAGMLYYRTDLVDKPPTTFAELWRQAKAGQEKAGIPYGFLWQGARYEGLVCVFLEHLGGFGGQIIDEQGRVVVDSDAAVRALTCMRDSIYREGVVPRATLGWQEEQTRFQFQNGNAVFLRNWPYAYALLKDAGASKVAGRFAVALMPAAPGGAPTATLGGSQLAINRHSEHPEAAYQVIEYLTRPEQMMERAQVAGQLPPRRSLYDHKELAAALGMPAEQLKQVRRLIEHTTARPVTPVYTELSEILQIWLHRALTGQAEPDEALANAARQMRALLARVGLSRE